MVAAGQGRCNLVVTHHDRRDAVEVQVLEPHRVPGVNALMLGVRVKSPWSFLDQMINRKITDVVQELSRIKPKQHRNKASDFG